MLIDMLLSERLYSNQILKLKGRKSLWSVFDDHCSSTDLSKKQSDFMTATRIRKFKHAYNATHAILIESWRE